MKLFKYGLPFAALALLASCSNDNLGEPANTPGQSTDRELGDGNYIDLNFAIPAISTRANSFDNGDENEYQVKDATLYIYDATQKCLGAVSLNEYFGLASDASVDITAKKSLQAVDISKYVKADDDSKSFGDYYALVILNKNGLTSKSDQGTKTNLPEADQPFSEWQSIIIDYSQTPENEIMLDNGYFTMTNALGWIGTVADDGPSCLVKFNGDNIYYKGGTVSTTPVSIYLNRCLSKVSIEDPEAADASDDANIGIGKWYSVNNSDNPNDYILFTGWALEVTNQQSYPVQNYSDGTDNQWFNKANSGINIGTQNPWGSLTNEYARFTTLSATNAGTGLSNFTRLYFGIDPNYTDKAPGQSYPFNHTTSAGVTFSTDLKLYCLENTFEVAAMLHDQTTTAVFKGYYLPNCDYDPNEGPAEPEEPYVVPTVGKDFLSYEGKYAVWGNALTLNIGEGETSKRIDQIFNSKPLSGDFTGKWGDQIGNDITDQAQRQAKALELEQAQYDMDYANVLKALGLGPDSQAVVNYHKDGIVYYSVLIRHFNDTELGLKATPAPDLGGKMQYNSESEILSLMEDAYPSGYDNYLLGRYGVLRNNWYELSLSAVNAIGDPSMPIPDRKTDDDKSELVMNVKINILAWAKRYQDVDLH